MTSLVLMVVSSMHLAAGVFPDPSSPVIPDQVVVPEVAACGRDYTPIASSPWKGDVTVSMDNTTFTTPQYGSQFLYLRLNSPTFAPLVRGHSYTIVVDFWCSADLAFAPTIMSFKEDQSKYYNRDYVSSYNMTQSRPELFNEGREWSMTGTNLGGNWTRWSTSHTPTVNMENPTGTIWVRFYLAEKVRKEVVSFSVRDMCVTKDGFTTDPPPKLLKYSEGVFEVSKPSQPDISILTQQSSCPWEEVGLQSWEGLFGQPTNTPPPLITIPDNSKVLITESSLSTTPYDKIVVPPSSELIFSDANISFSVRALVVEGSLRIGSPTCRVQGPVNILFWGDKSDPITTLNGFGTKGISVTGTGTIDLFGRRYFPTWSRLARTARYGDDRVYLQDKVNWIVGQEVVIVTTIFDDTDIGSPNQNEVRTIIAVSSDGTIIQFDAGLKYSHYAGQEYQGEVGLLSRNINLFSDPDPDGFGGHLIVAGRRGRIAGVATRFMGQTNVMARYPFHFHLMGGGSGSMFSDNVARDTYFRCFVIHGTHDVLETENIAFNATGNCYYVEDGVEENNTVSYNMAAHIKVIGEPAIGGSQSGDTFYSDSSPGGLGSGDRVQPVDSTAAGFYFSNAHNHIIGNVASGGWSGFGFPGLPKPIGDFKDDDSIEPSSRPFGTFYGNTAHSSGAYWPAAGCIYVGGELTQSGTKLKYSSGRKDRRTRMEKEPNPNTETDMWMTFNNTMLYTCNKGLLHWGKRVEVDQIEFHDISRAVTLFGEAWLNNALVNGFSGNVDAGYADQHHDAFRFYDVSVKSLITNTEFRNFPTVGPCRSFVLPGGSNYIQKEELCGVDYTAGASLGYTKNYIFSGPFHSDEFKPQQISATRGIKYTNVLFDNIVQFKIVHSGASHFFNFVDHDGTATQTGVPTLVGSNLDWWRICDDCRFVSEWSVWTCPKKPPPPFAEREIAFIEIQTPDINPSDGGIGPRDSCDEQAASDWRNCEIGYAALWGHGPAFGDERRYVNITQNAGITGVTGTGWYFWLSKGAAKKLVITPSQVPNGAVLRFATSYPTGTTFSVIGKYVYSPDKKFNVFSEASTIDEVWTDPLNKYFFDGSNLYLQLVMPDKYYNNGSRFERGGAHIWDVSSYWDIHIESDCVADSKGFCTAAVSENIPPWNEGCPQKTTAVPSTLVPTAVPTSLPTATPTAGPTPTPTAPPTSIPTDLPAGKSLAPDTAAPIVMTALPTSIPTAAPTSIPTDLPAGKTLLPDTEAPTVMTVPPTSIPTDLPAGKSLAPDTEVPKMITVPPSIPTELPAGKSLVPDTEVPTVETTSLPDGESLSPETSSPGRGVGSRVAADGDDSDNDIPFWIWIVVAAAVVVIGGLAAAAIIVVRKRKHINFSDWRDFDSSHDFTDPMRDNNITFDNNHQNSNVITL